MCDLVTLVMCVSLALVASSALPAASRTLPSARGDLTVASNDLHDNADCTHKCLLKAQTQEEVSGSKSSCNFKLFCDTLCGSHSKLVTPRLLRSLAACCRPRSRRRRSPAWAEAALIAHSVGMDVLPETYSSSKQREPPSNLRVTSLSSQGDTVDCQLAWDSRQEQGVRWYLVSWETEAAGRGNLLTPSSPVSLTLLPATLYHVQVSPSNSPEARVSLDVDTRRIQPPGASPQSTSQVLPQQQEVVAGVLAAALLFLSLVLVTVTRQRASAKSADCQRETQSQSKHFKVYSPPVTIVPVHLTSLHCVN